MAAFALVFAGCGAVVANASYDGAPGHGRNRPRLRPRDHGHGLRHRASLGGAHQSGGHDRLLADPPLPRPRGAGLHRRPMRRSDRRGPAAARRLARPTGPTRCHRPTIGVGSALVYEAVLTAFLMFVIMAVATDTRAVGAAAAIAIGGTVGLDALFGGPVTGASMNPARSLGPALASGRVDRLLDLRCGSGLGAAAGALGVPTGEGRRTVLPAATGGGGPDGQRSLRLPSQRRPLADERGAFRPRWQAVATGPRSAGTTPGGPGPPGGGAGDEGNRDRPIRPRSPIGSSARTPNGPTWW